MEGNELRDKVAIVTGGGRRIGFLCRYRYLLPDRDAKRVQHR